MQTIKYKSAITLTQKLRKREKKWLKKPKGRKPPGIIAFVVRKSYVNPERKVLAFSFADFRKLKVCHQFIPSKYFKKRVLDDLTIYANVDDVTLKRAPQNSLEGFANSLILASERIEQNAIRQNPPVFDKSYVERADYPLTSLYSDYKDTIESSTYLFFARVAVFGTIAWTTINTVTTWEDYRKERLKWQKCRHKFCLTYFTTHADNFKGVRPKRSDAVYCCQSCQESARDTEKRFNKTGSYLPADFYLPSQSQSVSDAVRRSEWASPIEKIIKQKHKNVPLRDIPKRSKPVNGKMKVFNTLTEAKAAYKPEEGVKVIA